MPNSQDNEAYVKESLNVGNHGLEERENNFFETHVIEYQAGEALSRH